MILDIYVFGDFDLTYKAMTAVKAFFHDSTGIGLIKVAAVLGFMMAGFKTLLSDGLHNAGSSMDKSTFGPGTFVLPVLLGFLVAGPTCDVIITDNVSGATLPVTEMPIAVVLPMSITTQIGRIIGDKFEETFQPVEGARMNKVGFMDSLYVLDKFKDLTLRDLQTSGSNSYDMDKTLSKYYQNCVSIALNSIDPPPTISQSQLLGATDIIAKLEVGNFANISTTVYLSDLTTPDLNEIQKTCSEAYQLIVFEFGGTSFLDSKSDLLKAKIFKKADSTDLASQIIQDAFDALGLSVVTASTSLTNRLVMSTLKTAELQQVASISQGSAAGYAMILAAAETSRNARWVTEKTLFDKYAKPFMAFIEVLAIASAPLMPFLLIIGNVKALFGWLTLTAWISMWGPILTLVNFYVITKCQTDLTAYMAAVSPGVSDISTYMSSIDGLNYISGVTNQWLAMGAMLSAATPVISMAVLTGGMSSLTGLASSISKTDPSTSMSPVSRASMENAPIMRSDPTTNINSRTGANSSTFAGQAAQMNMSASNTKGLSAKQAVASQSAEQYGNELANSFGKVLSTEQGSKAMNAAVGGMVNTKTKGLTQLGQALQRVSAATNSSGEYTQQITNAAFASTGADGKLDLKAFEMHLGGELRRGGMHAGAARDVASKATDAAVAQNLSGSMAQQTATSSGRQLMAGLHAAIASQTTKGDKESLLAAKTASINASNELARSSANTQGFGSTESKPFQTALANAIKGNPELTAQMLSQAALNPQIDRRAKEIAEGLKAQGQGVGIAGGALSRYNTGVFQALVETMESGKADASQENAIKAIGSAGAFTSQPFQNSNLAESKVAPTFAAGNALTKQGTAVMSKVSAGVTPVSQINMDAAIVDVGAFTNQTKGGIAIATAGATFGVTPKKMLQTGGNTSAKPPTPAATPTPAEPPTPAQAGANVANDVNNALGGGAAGMIMGLAAGKVVTFANDMANRVAANKTPSAATANGGVQTATPATPATPAAPTAPTAPTASTAASADSQLKDAFKASQAAIAKEYGGVGNPSSLGIGGTGDIAAGHESGSMSAAMLTPQSTAPRKVSGPATPKPDNGGGLADAAVGFSAAADGVVVASRGAAVEKANAATPREQVAAQVTQEAKDIVTNHPIATAAAVGAVVTTAIVAPALAARGAAVLAETPLGRSLGQSIVASVARVKAASAVAPAAAAPVAAAAAPLTTAQKAYNFMNGIP